MRREYLESLRLGRWLFNYLQDHRVHKVYRDYDSRNPVTLVSGLPAYDEPEIISHICETAGISVVLEEDEIHLIGRESHVGVFADIMENRRYLDHFAMARAFKSEWELPRAENANEELKRLRKLVSPEAIAWEISKTWPQLRIWPDEPGYDKELPIQLKRESGPYKLGGVSLGVAK